MCRHTIDLLYEHKYHVDEIDINPFLCRLNNSRKSRNLRLYSIIFTYSGKAYNDN